MNVTAVAKPADPRGERDDADARQQQENEEQQQQEEGQHEIQ